VVAVQGHPKSLISVLIIKSASEFSDSD